VVSKKRINNPGVNTEEQTSLQNNTQEQNIIQKELQEGSDAIV